MSKEETLLVFPCAFSLKAMGLAGDAFKDEVYALIKTKVPELKQSDLTIKPSKTGKYHSISIAISATSKQQLDDLYHLLTDCESVLMAL